MEAAAEETQKEGTAKVVPDHNSGENISTQPPSPEHQKKSKKDDRPKKEDKNVEQFMKSLNSVPTLEEKLSLACKRYVHSIEDNRKMQFYIKQSERRYALLVKEKDQLQLEYNKTILVKSKLENLCRELQKQNKAIKEESLLKIKEEEERRKETQAKFQNTLSEITALLQQNNEKNSKLRDDNISMTEKFKSVVQQYQLREQQVDKMAKQMSLESQLSDAKLQKASLEHQADKERLLSEMEQMKVTIAQYRAKIMEFQGTETGLRSQLAVYTDKYDEFQNALVKSNQVFGGFKEQMDKMSKKIKQLEKESLSWKKRWESSQTALLEMCTERQAAVRQLHHMQSLCRTLQAERTVLVGTLKEHNIERPPLPAPAPASAPAPAPAPAPASNAKVDAMAANCAQLRQSLAHLQNQLNVLTNKQENSSPEEPPKPEKTKKSKSKKSKADKAQKQQDKIDTPKDGSDESAAKETDEIVAKETDDNKTSANDDKAQIESPEEKVDDKTLESLIQAINNANINLCDLEVVGDADIEFDNADELLQGVLNDIELSAKHDAAEAETNDKVLVVDETLTKETGIQETISNVETVSNEELGAKETVTNVETVLNKEAGPKETISNAKPATKKEKGIKETISNVESPKKNTNKDVSVKETVSNVQNTKPEVTVAETKSNDETQLAEVETVSNDV